MRNVPCRSEVVLDINNQAKMQNKDTIFQNVLFHPYVIQANRLTGNDINKMQVPLKSVLPSQTTKQMEGSGYHLCSTREVLRNDQELGDLPEDTCIKVKVKEFEDWLIPWSCYRRLGRDHQGAKPTNSGVVQTQMIFLGIDIPTGGQGILSEIMLTLGKQASQEEVKHNTQLKTPEGGMLFCWEGSAKLSTSK